METPTPDAAGLLLVDKPPGITSHDVVAIVRRMIGARRVGHAGTLDPFATGLLVVLVGRGTRLIPYIDGEPKVYDATIRFGAETDTDDATGTIVREAELPNEADVSAAITRLSGVIEQVPPSYSAKKVAGTRAYAAARRGVALELQPSRVTIHRWEARRLANGELTARITCTGGTYIRALARDLGRLSNSAAHLVALRRMRSGAFTVDEAQTLDQLRGGDVALRPLRDAIPSLPTRCVDEIELGRVLHGNAIDADAADGETGGPRVALVDAEQTLIAVAEREGSELRPKLVLRDA